MLSEAVWSVKVQKPMHRGSTLRVSIPADIAKTLDLKPGDRLVVKLVELEVGNKKVKAIVYYKP
jgi:AbrB family looped-hinge helix DNA binding protein